MSSNMSSNGICESDGHCALDVIQRAHMVRVLACTESYVIATHMHTPTPVDMSPNILQCLNT